MMPTVTNGRVDQRLTNVLLAYTNPAYFADRIFPVVGGLKDDTGLIPTFGKSHLRQYSSKRSLYDESQHRVDFQINTDKTYRIDYCDLSVYVPDRLKEQMRSPFDAHSAANLTAIEALKLEREIAVAALMTSTTVLTNNTDLTSTAARHYDQTTSTPLKDIETAVEGVFLKTGRQANKLTIERSVANALRSHADIKAISIAKINGGKGTQPSLSKDGLVETLKSWFNLEDVIIVQNVMLTSKEGQTDVLGTVWGKDIVAYYCPSAPSIMTPSFGYSFQLQDYNLRSVIRRAVSDKGDEVEAMWGYQDNVVDADAAYLVKGCL